MDKILLFLGGSIILFIVGASCVTGTVTDGSILEYQRQVSSLEARNTELTNRLDRYESTVSASVERLEDLGARAGKMGSTIDEVIQLFGQYQREVERLVSDYNAIKNKAPDSN